MSDKNAGPEVDGFSMAISANFAITIDGAAVPAGTPDLSRFLLPAPNPNPAPAPGSPAR